MCDDNNNIFNRINKYRTGNRFNGFLLKAKIICIGTIYRHHIHREDGRHHFHRSMDICIWA